MSYHLAIKDKEGKYQRFTVPLEVSLYVKQLEAYIMLPGISKLKEAYPERFAEAPDLLAACKVALELIESCEYAGEPIRENNYKFLEAVIAKAERDITGKSNTNTDKEYDYEGRNNL